ncbi:hypothetical protein O181_010905 [Austropuccinia psidii MF-1]|uniref:Uncharacterized protein n=1 Tax=Austropuccinia psidii MF-1 TaxID=1389203 RepID=A0A9Q3GLD8_9BASI|nr:hypothetical protein [Austropuccinia psidii MF-1]
MPCKKTLQQQTPGLIGTEWPEDLFQDSSQHDEPPIPGLSQCSKPQVPSHEDTSTCEPEPEEAPMQFMEEPFGKSPLHLFLTAPLTISSLSRYNPSVIIIDDTPI